MANQKPQMTPEQQMKFRQAVNQGAQEPLPYKDYCAITPEQAEAKIKEWAGKGAVDFSKPLSNRREAPAREQAAPEKSDALKTPEQAATLIKLVSEKRLNPISRSKWPLLTSKEAGKLIYIGKQREAAGEFAPPMEPRQQPEKETAAPEKTPATKNKTASKARSRGNDLSM